MVNIPVFLSSDDNYAAYVASTVASICDNTKEFIDFYILDGGITEVNKKRIEKLKEKFNNFSIEFIYINPEKEFKNFSTTGHISLSAYNRLLIPKLKPNLGKVIYSDIDVIFIGDVKEFYSESLDDYSLAAVWENNYENGYNIERKKRLNLSEDHKYFCSGHLIIDSKKWIENNSLEILMKIAKEEADSFKSLDQDALNIYFDNNYKPLPSKYSFFYGIESQDRVDDVVIRHYTQIKPWEISPELDNSFNTDHGLFWKYVKMTDFYEELTPKTKYNDLNSLRKRCQIMNIVEKQYRG